MTVNYATSDGTAIAGRDYTAVSNGSVTIAAGNTTAEFTVSMTGDETDELDETFNVTISMPEPEPDLNGGGSGEPVAAITGGDTAAAVGTILDDDPAVVTVAPKVDTVEEGEAAVFVLTRAGLTNGALAMQVRLRAPGRLQMLDARFEPGAVTTEIAVATHNNNLVDYPSVRDYTIEVFGDGAPLGQDDRSFTPGAPATATVKVTDDDELINVTVYPVKAIISRGNPYWIFRRDGDISQPLSALFGYYLHKSDRSRTEITYGATASFEAGQDEVVLTYHDYDFVEDIEYPPEDKGIFPITLTYTVFGDGGQYGLHRIYQGGNPNTATVTMEYNGYERRLVVGAEAPLWVSVGQTVNIPLMVTNAGSLDSGTQITITSTHYSQDRLVNGTNEPRMTCQFDGPIAAGESAGCEVSFLVLEKDLNWRNEAEIELDVVASDGRTTSNAFRIFMRVRNGVSVGFKETANLPVTEPGFGEANARANLTVTRVGQSGEEVQVAYTLEPWPTGFRSYSPVEGVDYADNSATPGVITFGENETEKTITIDILGDQIDEAKEQFLVTLVPPEGVLVEEHKRTRIVVINDTNPPPGESYRPTASLQLVSSGPVPESEGPVEFAIVLDREWGIDALYEVELTFDQLTATPGIARLGKKGDFEDPGVLVARIPAGQTRFEFSIPLYDDDVREEDETFQLLLGSSIDKSFRTIGPSNTALATIADDDRIPPTEVELSLSHRGRALASVPEGSNRRKITVTASFAQVRWPGDAANALLHPADPLDVDTTVRVQVDPNSGATHAAGLDDFEPLRMEDALGEFQVVESFDIVIPAGQTSGNATVRFWPVKDDVDEEEETVTLQGSEVVAGGSEDSLPVRSASFTIIDDDTRGITLSPAKLAAGTGISMKEGGTSTYSLVLDSEPTDTVTVTVAGRQGDLISLTPETLTFTPSDWSTAQTISVVSLDDGTDTSFTNAVISHQVSGGDYGSVTVRDIWMFIKNTTQAYIYLDDAQASESDGYVEFTVTVRPILRTTPVLVRYATVNGTAIAGSDYTREVETGQTYKLFNIPAGRSSGIIRIPITDDEVYESADETFTLQLTNDNNKATLDGGATSLTATGAITDDDPKPVVSVAGPGGEVSYVSENAKDPVTFTLTLVGQSAGDVTVDYATGEAGLLHLFTDRQGLAGATENEDYAGASGTVTFTSGQTTKTVTVQVTNDDVSEDTEFFGFRISAPQGADLRGQRSEDVADVGLLDDDPRGVTIDPTSISLHEPASGQTAVAGAYTVKLSSSPTDTVTVTIGGGDPAVSLSGDTLTNNQLTFTTTNWNMAQTITVTPVKDDNAVGETVTLTHTVSGGDYAGIAADSVTVNLIDSDARNLVLSEESLAVTEGDATGVGYTVKLATQPSDTVTVAISGHDGTDLTLSGTTLTNNQLTFTTTNWGTAQTVTVKPGDDDNTDGESETLAHTASGGDYVNITKDLPVSITDDDEAQVTVSFGATGYTVLEGGMVTVTVTLSANPQRTVVIPIVATDQGGASSADDYSGVPSSVTFSSGQTYTSFPFTAAQDDVDDDDERVLLAFGTLPSRVSAGTTSTSTVSITDVQTLVSNTAQGSDSDASYTSDHGQAFTTGYNLPGYTVTGVTIISEDAQGDDIDLQVCEVDGNGLPTTACTDLTPPATFAAGPLTFNAPTGSTLTADTAYMVVFKTPGGDQVQVNATTSDDEDSSSLPDWSIRDLFQWKNNQNIWQGGGRGRSIRITIQGTVNPPSATAPTAMDSTVSATEDTAYIFTAADFNFSATTAGDTLASVRILTLPAEGTLALSGAAVTVNQLVTKAQLDAGILMYTPPANANGTGYASFLFRVSGSSEASTSAYSMTIDVSAVNDPATGTPAIGGIALVGQTLTASTGGIADADGLPSTFIYQWKRYAANGTTFEANIGADSNRYTLTASEEGKKVLVEASFTDNGGGSEGPLVSPAYPASGTVGAAPLVSNTGQGGDQSATYTSDHGQAFTTGDNLPGYNITSVTIISEDPNDDDIDLQICEVDSDGNPTTTCTDLTAPDSFARGPLVFNVPAGSTLTFAAGTTYMVVFKAPGAVEVRVDATTSDDEDSTSLPDWSIRDLFQWNNAGSWQDGSRGRAIRIAIQGTVNPPLPSALVPFDPATFTREVNENTGANQNVGSPVTATYTGTCTLTYALGGADDDSFEIDSSTGQIKTKSGVTYDHEAKSTYTVTVTASDANCGADDATVTINVNDVNEPPRVPLEVVAHAVPRSYDQLFARWTPPENAGRPDITGYAIQYGQGSQLFGISWRDGPQNVDGTSATISGPSPYSHYHVRVRAKNDEGSGPWSEPYFTTTNILDFEVETSLPFIPDGLVPGDRFHLLFVTPPAQALKTILDDYYNLAASPVITLPETNPFQRYWKFFYPVASIRHIDARVITNTTYTNEDKGAPIYWVGGGKAADDYEDFYDGDWDDESARNARGEPVPLPDGVWTGSTADGRELMDGGTSRALGQSMAGYGAPGSTTTGEGPFYSGSTAANTGRKPIFSLSSVFRIVNPPLATNEGQMSDTDDRRSAMRSQTFTTGSNRHGYELSGVALGKSYRETTRIELSIYSVDANGHPDTLLFACTNLDSYTNHTQAYNAPAGATLDPGTTYAVVVQPATSGDDLNLYTTASDNEDDESLDGWSITDAFHYGSGGSWQAEADGKALKIIIRGTAKAGTSLAPTGLTATAVGRDRIDLSWTAPTDDGGSAITGYRIESSADVSTGWADLVADTGSAATTHPHSGLMPNTTRHYRVSAINGEGASDPSGAANATTADNPAVTVSFGATTYTAAEGRTVDVAVSLDVDPERTVVIPITATPQGTTTTDDYSVAPTSVTFDAGDMSKTITFTATQDNLDDDGESVKLTFGMLPSRVSAGTTATTTVSITDDDTPPTASDGTVTTVEDTDHTFVADEFGYADADNDPLASVKIIELPAAGTGALTLNGTAIPSADLPKTVTATELTGGGLKYAPPANANGTGYASFKFKVNDGTADSAEYTITINMTAVNDPATGTPTISGTAQVGQMLTASTGDIADPDGVPSAFTYQWKRYAADRITFEANIGTDSMTYTLTASEEGKKVLVEVSFTDNGGSSEGPLVSALYPSTQSQTVDPNNPPTASDGTVTTVEDTAHSFAADEFGYADADGDALAHVKIIELPAAGTGALTLNGTAITSADLPKTVTAAELTGGGLKYAPPANANGTGYASFKFKVNDGTADSASEYFMTINVTAVNDPATGAPTISGTAHVGLTLTASTAGIDDVDGLPSAFTCQWKRVDADGTSNPTGIGADSSAYTLTAAEEGKKVLVEVSFTDNGGSSEGPLVSAAYPSSGTVVNLTVSFGETTYMVTENGTISVIVHLSADPERTVAIPITATPQDSASSADYTVPTSVIFNAGDMSKTITFMATQDAEDDDGESVLLAFGILPDGVNPGTRNETTVSITDDDEAAIVLSETDLTVTEGDAAGSSYTVRLATRPSGSVSVAITGHAGTDLSLDNATLTFTVDNWDTAQTVTVKAGEDHDAANDTAALTHTASGGDYANLTVGLPVTVTDDDTPGVTIEPTALSVVAGRSNEYTVRLATEPTGDVTVTVSGHAGTDLSLDKTTLTFTVDNWDTAQTVTVSATQNAATAKVSLAHAVAGADYGSVTAEPVVVSVVGRAGQQPTLQVGVSSSAQTLTIPEGGANSYTLVLGSRPTGDVTVGVTLPTGTDLTLDKTSLTFTSTNWDVAQTVAVTAAEDDDGVTDAGVTLTHTVSGGGYNSTSVPDVEVSITENDTAGIVISKDSLTVGEGDPAGSSYTVKLATQPSGEVTVTISGQAGTDLTLDKTTLTFTVDNWDTAQTVTVTAGEDDDGANDTASLTHTVSGGDYASVSNTLPVTVTDDDAADILLSETHLTVAEGDAAGSSYTVKLATQPSGSVSVSITGQAGTDLTLDKTTLTFTADNWNTAQTVTVTAGEDDDGANDTASLTHTASGGDYASVSNTLPVTVTDDDAADILLSETHLTVAEGDAAGSSYTVKLATQPSGSVSVSITGQAGTDLTLDKTTLTFTADNWNTAQTVTVTAGHDDDDVNDTASLTHTASGGDYANLTVGLPVNIIDDDDPQVTVSFMAATYTVAEGESQSVTVTLSADPDRTVVIPLTATPQDGTSSTDYSAPTSVTFNTNETSKTIPFTQPRTRWMTTTRACCSPSGRACQPG